MERDKNSIVFLAGQLGLGGAEKQLFLLIESLIHHNYKITVIDFYPQQQGYWRKPIENLGVNLISHYSQSKLKRIFRITNELRKIKPNIVHGWHFHTNGYANLCGKLARVPIRIGSVRENPDYWSKPNFINFSCLYGLDGIIFNSKISYKNFYEKTIFTKKGIFPKTYIVHNGIHPPNPYAKEELREELEDKRIRIPYDSKVIKIIGIGRLDKNKNWQLLINSCAAIKNFGINFYCLIIGDGPERIKIQQQIAHHNLSDQITLSGQITNASRFLPLFDILCSCSNSEGLPNVILEAASYGLPVLATDVGGTREVIEPSVNGLLVKKNNLEEFSENLWYLIKNNKARVNMGVEGKKKIYSHFSVDQMVKNTIKVYHDLAK